jgi:hypothetical protein
LTHFGPERVVLVVIVTFCILIFALRKSIAHCAKKCQVGACVQVAGSGEQVAGNREQGAVGGGRGAGSSEQRAAGRE